MTSLKTKRQRKFFLILPLLVLPFLTLFFWALGGGKGEAATKAEKDDTGFDMQLPQPHFEQNKEENKLAYYLAADRDSEKLQEEIKSDPYRDHSQLAGNEDSIALTNNNPYQTIKHTSKPSAAIQQDIDGRNADSNALKVYQKLDQLKKALKENNNSPDLSPDDPLPAALCNFQRTFIGRRRYCEVGNDDAVHAI